MYSWLWRRLPGGTAVRASVMAVLALAATAALWTWVFPWAANYY